jgi:hypothetical protein
MMLQKVLFLSVGRGREEAGAAEPRTRKQNARRIASDGRVPAGGPGTGIKQAATAPARSGGRN